MKLPHYVILALLLVIGAMWFFWPQPKDPDYTVFDAELKKRATRLSELIEDHKQQQERILARFEKDSLDKVAYRNEIKALKSKIAQRRPRIDSIIVDSPELKEFISMQDSVIVRQQARIDSLDATVGSLEIDIGKVTDNFMERLKLQSETIDDQKLIIEDQRKQLRKERRNKKIAKILVPVVAVGAFLLGGAF